MISHEQQWGTIGGGNLEYEAIARARRLLDVSSASMGVNAECVEVLSTAPERVSFALGPSLGQCCGGQVELLFERIDQHTEWLSETVSLIGKGASKRHWLCRSLSCVSQYHIVEEGHASPWISIQQLAGCRAGVFPAVAATPGGRGNVLPTRDASPADNSAEWWCEEIDPELPEVWVFGAGHVGRALHEQLSLLPCRSVALDCRDEFLQTLPPVVRTISTDCCATEVSEAPAGVWFIVMTHSHSQDFDICHAVLQRTDFAYLGLIGSESKRAMFAKRLAHRGIAQNQIDRLISPIGLTSIRSRLPQHIALGVAVDLTLRWQQAFPE